jgi:hypothetical protein
VGVVEVWLLQRDLSVGAFLLEELEKGLIMGRRMITVRSDVDRRRG